MWVCPYCGTHNFCEERVGRKEPLCSRCREEKISAYDLQDKIEREISDLEFGLTDLKNRAEPLIDQLVSYEVSIADIRGKIFDIQTEMGVLEIEIADRRNMVVHQEPVKYPAKDQKLLI